MLNMLLEGEGTNFFTQYGLLIILVVMLIAMFVWNFFRQKKAMQQEDNLREHMKVGTKVKTYAGVYGTIVGIYDTTDGKVARLSLLIDIVFGIIIGSICGIICKSLSK